MGPALVSAHDCLMIVPGLSDCSGGFLLPSALSSVVRDVYLRRWGYFYYHASYQVGLETDSTSDESA